MMDKVKVSKGSYKQLVSLALESSKEGKETGGYLSGFSKGNTIVIKDIVGAGPNAKRGPAIFEPDYVHGARELKRLKDEKGQHLVGGWHTHNGFGGELSPGDVVTLKGVVGEYPKFIAVLLNVANGQCSVNAFTVVDNEVKRLQLEVIEDQETQIKPQDVSFQRTEKLYSHEFLREKAVLVIGLGSGGSVEAIYLARTGIGLIGLIDHEKVEEVNLIRHIAFWKDIGKRKTNVVYHRIRNINKTIRVRRHNLKVSAVTIGKLKNIVRDYDLIISCTGHPLTNHFINSFCLELKIPAVYAGVFPQASGGFVLQVIPDETCCFNCVYDYAKLMVSDTKEELQSIKERYGISDDQLSAHQGLFTDISFIALLQAKFALLTLLRNQRHFLGNPAGNLVLWNSLTLSSKVIQMKPRPDCSICSKEGNKKSREDSLERLLMGVG